MALLNTSQIKRMALPVGDLLQVHDALVKSQFVVTREPVLIDDPSEATCVCDLCKRMYVERPFLCLCKSNAFLRDMVTE